VACQAIVLVAFVSGFAHTSSCCWFIWHSYVLLDFHHIIACMYVCALHIDSALMWWPSKLQFNIDVCSTLIRRICIGANRKGQRGAFILHECQQHSLFIVFPVLDRSRTVFTVSADEFFYRRAQYSLNLLAVKIPNFMPDTSDGAVYSSEAESWCQKNCWGLPLYLQLYYMFYSSYICC